MGRRASLPLARLATMGADELRAEWMSRIGAPTPNLSADLLRLGIGYRLQEMKLGGLSRATRSLLRQVAMRTVSGSGRGAQNMPMLRKLTPGTRLVRDWHGEGHTVIVLVDGFEYDGKQWRSLTAIAKVITGGHWNGPLFFGLAERKKAS